MKIKKKNGVNSTITLEGVKGGQSSGNVKSTAGNVGGAGAGIQPIMD